MEKIMEIDIHYRISRSETTENKETATLALLQKKEVVKVVRTKYISGTTTVILTTLTDIKNVKDL
jgi:hypothetical protein